MFHNQGENQIKEIIHAAMCSVLFIDESQRVTMDDIGSVDETANYNLDGIDYDIRVCDTPGEVRDIIFERNKAANRARILAGYCWEWLKKERNNSNYHDIQIGDFGISWNLNDGQAFAISPDSVNEAGCIHTTQGLEFDYVGVTRGMKGCYIYCTDKGMEDYLRQRLASFHKNHTSDAKESPR